METKAKYINGYWRNQDSKAPTTTKDESNPLVAFVLLALAGLLLAVMLWQTVLAVGISTGAGVAAKKYFEHKNDPEKLIVNRY